MPAAKKKALKPLPALGPVFTETANTNTPLADIVETIMPAVVNIFVLHGEGADAAVEAMQNGNVDLDSEDENDPEKENEDNNKLSAGNGSGFVIDGTAGYIVTNNHVVADASKIVVTFPDDDMYLAELVGTDPLTDIAVIKLKELKRTVPQAVLGDSDKIRPGNRVIVIGSPFHFSNSVSTGIVSALHRELGSSQFDDFIQTDAAMNPGNSGGPLFNLGGQVVGMNTAIVSGGGHASSAGIGFSIPSNQVRWTAQQLITYGEVKRAVLGIGIAAVTSGLADKFGLAARQGVFVRTVVQDGPSWKAGLRPNDIVISMDGKNVNHMRELRAAVAAHAPHEKMSVTFWREGEIQRTRITLGEVTKEAAKPDEMDMELDPDVEAEIALQMLKEEIKDELRQELIQEFGLGQTRPRPNRPIRPHHAPKYRP